MILKNHSNIYVLTNEVFIVEADDYKRRSKTGILVIIHRRCKTEYNTEMGGVNVSDMKYLFCELWNHGSRRWYIRVFLYHHEYYIDYRIKAEVNNLYDFKMVWLN